MATTNHLVDGSMSFSAGVNSLKPTTIASAQNPDGLARNSLAWLNNGTVRGGGITCRNGWQYLCTVRTAELYQGGFMYKPDSANPYLVLSIAGRLWRIRVDTNNAVDELTSPGLVNPAAELQSFFVQGEQFMIVQSGDDVTLPLIWDGTTLRRSFGNNRILMGTTTTIGWQVPAPGGAVTVTIALAAPYPGFVGDQVFVDYVGIFEVISIAGNNIELATISTAKKDYIIMYTTDVWLTPAELPAGTAMEYYMGRIWYVRGRTLAAGDIVKGPSGTLVYNFRDSILMVTENPLAVGGDGFTVPSDAGNIRALFYTAELDSTLGQGQLYMGTRSAIYRLTVPASRDAWIDASDATQPLQTVAHLGYGPVGDRCVVRSKSDVFYQTMEPAISSLALARRNFNQWGNTGISRNEDRVLRFNDRELLRFASGIEFSNRLLQTALPTQTAVGVAFKALVPLDFDLISTLEEKLPPAWEGINEVPDMLQVFVADFGGRERAFAAVRGSDDDSIQVWEITDYLKSDFNRTGERRITWITETPAYTFGQEFLLKKLVGGELWIDRVYGEVVFKIEYRPDGDACWHYWHAFKVCSARNSCEDVNNPVCYPITNYAEGFRQTLSLPEPLDGCQSTTGRPLNIAYQFQVKITVTGWCRIRGLLLYAEPREQKMYHDIPCSGGEVIMPDNEPVDTMQPEQVQDIGAGVVDPFLGPPYPPTGYSLFVDPEGQPRLYWTAPDVIIEGDMLVRYAPFVMFEFFVTNYEWPAWNGATTYENNQRSSFGGIRYASLQDNNTNHQPNLSPTFWTVDPTEFELWKFNGSVYVKIGDSTGFGAGTVSWDWTLMRFTADLPAQSTWAFYIVANAGISATAQSNVFGFTDNCTPPAPTNLLFTQTGPQGGDFTWLEGGTGALLDYIIAVGQTAGGPYNVFDASIAPDAAFYHTDGLSGGTYYAIMCRRDSATCVSARSNEVTFSLP